MTSIVRQADIAFQANLYTDPNPTRRGLHATRRAWIEERLREFVTPQSNVLEVGVGCGIYTRFLSGTGAQVTAVDINADFIDDVRDLPNVTAQVRDATLPLELAGQDVALSSEVLEHVPPAQSTAMLQAVRGALKPGGVFILTTPQRYAAMELTARLLKFAPVLWLARKVYGAVDELGHINLLTRHQLERQIDAAGFSIERATRFGFYLPVIADFGGERGRRLLVAIERMIRDVPVLRGLIWTQAYVLRAR